MALGMLIGVDSTVDEANLDVVAESTLFVADNAG